MRNYPPEVTVENDRFVYEKILKDDFFSVNVLYRNERKERYVLKLSDFRFVLGWLLRPFAAAMSRHEYRIYSLVRDIPGVPKLGPRWGRRGYLHEYIDGKTLHEVVAGDELPDDFFDRLSSIIRAIHARRIFYLDLNKRGNIIVGRDRKPYLIDFQICMHFKSRRGVIGRWSDRLFERLIKEDIYHLYKHKKKFQPQLLTGAEAGLAQRSRLAQRYNRYFGRPYRKVKRMFYPSGSNEIIWYKWKRMKDQSRRMP